MQNEENRFVAIKERVAKEAVDKIKKAIEQVSQNQINTKLVTRYNAPYMPIVEVQDIECPPKD